MKVTPVYAIPSGKKDKKVLNRVINEKSMSVLFSEEELGDLESFFMKKGLINKSKNNIVAKINDLKSFFKKS